jgi:hypothetical protein
MGLTEKGSNKILPNGSGGWYWLKMKGKDWEPIKVSKAINGWPSTVVLAFHQVDVKDVEGEWGSQIFPPTSHHECICTKVCDCQNQDPEITPALCSN